MSFEQRFLKDFKAWVDEQVAVNDLALKTSQGIWQSDGDDRAREAAIRYESRLDAYRFLQHKFTNYEAGKEFHDFSDDFLDKRSY